MKKAIVVLMVVAVFLLVGCQTVSAANLQKITIQTLPADSKNAGEYFAKFCNRGECWEDTGTYTPIEAFFSRPTVHTAYLQDDSAYLVLSAKDGYQWTWNEGGLFGHPGYILEKK